jgi:hypothetical protein
MHEDREILTQKIRSDFDRLASVKTEDGIIITIIIIFC